VTFCRVCSAVCFALLISIPAAIEAAPAARVVFATSGVSAIASDGRERPLGKGDAVNEGEAVATGIGRAQLQFSDGAYVSLQPDSLFRIDQYRFQDQANGDERGFFSLLKGGMRTITGLIGRTNKRNYRVNTEVAAIGIRGTEYTLRYGNSVHGSVGEGEIDVCNGAGCLSVANGQSFLATAPNVLPILTAVRTSLPPPQPPPVRPRLPSGDESQEQLGLATAALDLSESVPPLGLTDGTGYLLAYARDQGSPASAVVTPGAPAFATFDGTGQLHSYAKPGEADLAQVTPQIAEFGADEIIGWGRWVDSYQDAGQTIPLRDQQGFHYAVGRATPAPALNSGQGTYTLLGATHPTGSDNGQPGTLNSMSLFVDFSLRKVGLELSVDYGGRTYSASTTGGASAAGVANSQLTLNRGLASFEGSGLTTTGCVSGACATQVHGFFAGPNAERSGVAYEISDGGASRTVHGSAALTR